MQTTEFETSIKLKKLGILQTATFEHVDHKYIPKSNLNYGFRLKKSDNLYSEDAIFADAYTLDEVLDMLPRDILYSFGIKDCNNDYKAYIIALALTRKFLHHLVTKTQQKQQDNY